MFYFSMLNVMILIKMKFFIKTTSVKARFEFIFVIFKALKYIIGGVELFSMVN